MSRRRTPQLKSQGFWSGLFKFGLYAGLFFGLVGIVILIAVGLELPEVAKRATFERKPSITVLAADGSVVARYGDYFQGHVNVKSLPDHVKEAVMAIEDRRFYHHFGLDPFGLLRAIATNAARGSVVQGGSTITQQLAKNLFLTPERSLKRKLQEVLLAFWLEAQYTKDEILSAYLNRVYFGSGAYGIEAAARVYYDRRAKNLTVYQAATLAGLLKAPSRYAPNRNPENAQKRTEIVLDAMVDAGYLDEKEKKKAIADKGKPVPKAGGSKQYFADWILDQVDSYAGDTDEDLIVKTTFEPSIQASAEKAFDAKMAEAAERGVSQGAVVVMRPDGPVLAMIGGRDYSDSSFNRATQAKRQPGSSFKPFVYLAALEQGIDSGRLVLDAPFTSGKYRPQNYDGEYRGPVPLYRALAASLNTATIRLAQHVGIDNVISTARRAGISSPLEANLSLALGSNEVSLLEMAGAYSTFARMGEANTPYGITEIQTQKGKTLYNREKDEPFYRGAQRFNSGDIARLRFMLKSVVDWGTGTGARMPDTVIMGKTGTSQDYHDAWFIGFNDTLLCAVWMGNDNNKSMKRITGGTLPAPLFRDIMGPSLQALQGGRTHTKPLAANGYIINPGEGIGGFFGGMGGNIGGDGVPQAPEEAPVDNNGGFGDVLQRYLGSEGESESRNDQSPANEIPQDVPQGEGDTEAPSQYKFNQ